MNLKNKWETKAMRNFSLERFTKSFVRFWVRKSHYILYILRENLEQWWTIWIMAGLLRLLEERAVHQCSKWQTNSEQHLKHSLASVKVSVCDSTTPNIVGKSGSNVKTTADQKSSKICQQTSSWSPIIPPQYRGRDSILVVDWLVEHASLECYFICPGH